MDGWHRNMPYGAPHQPPFRPTITGPVSVVTAPVGKVLTTGEIKQHCRVDPDNEDDDAYLDDCIAAAVEYCELEVPGSRQTLSATYDLPVHLWWGGYWAGFGPAFAASWPHPLKLPRPPLQQVVSITYTDTSGNVQTLDPTVYVVHTPWRMPGWIERKPFAVWPAFQADMPYPITVRFVAGYGPSTSIAAAIAAGTQTVTPASMAGIYAGTQLRIDADTVPEQVQVTSVTGTTFTATFARDHQAGAAVTPGIPLALRRAVQMLSAYWYEQRETCAPGGAVSEKVAFSVDSLLGVAGYGGYA